MKRTAALRQARFSHKIIMVLGLFALLGAGLTGLAAQSIRQLANEEGRLIKVHVASLRLAARSQESLTRMHQLEFQIVSDDADDDTPSIARFRSEADELAASVAALRPLIGSRETSVFKTASDAADSYVGLSSRIHALVSHDRRAALELLLTSGVAAFDRGDTAFDTLIDGVTDAVNQEATSAQAAATASLWLIIVTGGLGLVSISVIALVIVRRQISAPLGQVTDAMNRLANGDLEADVAETPRRDEIGDLGRAFRAFRQASLDYRTAQEVAEQERRLVEEERLRNEEARAATAREQAEAVEALGAGLSRLAAGDLVFRIGGAFPDSYAKLRDDFNAAMDQLQDAMSVIKESIFGIRASADEISQSAEDLSRRTEQQAANLEESAAALDQITNTVRRTAESSAEASTVVLAATTDAERSSIVVRDAIGAMGEIEQSAQQISQIIGVIDEIAFQTNLLALNAGVEAARAGDAGRGFAVVASEVRALAQRSAVAAKEIKALISTSGRQVASGVQLVGQTGQALERILINIGEVNTLVAKIAGSATEQAGSLHEVNAAVDQMDHGTQQNASMVEENTAASFALASEAQQLAALIDRFEIGVVAAPAVKLRPGRPAASPRPMSSIRKVANAAFFPDRPKASGTDGGWEEF